MNDFNRVSAAQKAEAAGFDAGLRSYMLKVYNYMGMALAVTGLLAYFASTSAEFLGLMYNAQTGGMSGFGWLITLAPLGFILALSFGINRMSLGTAHAVFWGYSAVMGLSLAPIFLIYTGASIAKVFFITSATFGAMSLWGYTTKKDLSGMGSFLFMGLIGIIIASIVNIFIGSSAMSFIISIIGVGIFTGLTAYDTQKIKQTYYMVAGQGEAMGKAALMGALSLYLDFVNLMLMLLRLIGDRR